jgi:hypothetical protein
LRPCLEINIQRPTSFDTQALDTTTTSVTMKRSIATIQAILVAGVMADAVFSPNITVSSVTVGTTLPVGYTPGNGHDIDLFLGNSTDNFPIVGRSEAWLGKPV